tara:strand:+ start:915 stop:1205 length:291 start_codon:yes stop_codon:yes gene_type:complete
MGRLALDVLRIYLDWEPKGYQRQGAQTLADTVEMSMFESPQMVGRKIVIKKLDEKASTRKKRGYTEYEVEGFPREKSFPDFKKSIDNIYKDLLNDR